MNVLITGATGFVGYALVGSLIKRLEYKVSILSRRFDERFSSNVEQIIGSSEDSLFKTSIPSNIDVIIHLAGRAHILNEHVKSPLHEFRKVNVDGTLHLAHQALENKVKRFIFMSSIGVNGSSTIDKPFNELDEPHPHADYAVSKLEAEQALKELFKNTETELVIIRPPLVYASNAPGNFARLLKLASTNLPLPFSGVNNKRSFIALDNLVHFIECCIKHPCAKNELFLISDNEELSTKQLVTYLRQGMAKSPNLIYVPNFVMKLGAICLGKMKLYEQLFGSLEINNSKAKRLLGWQAPVSAMTAVKQVGETYSKLR